MDTLTGTFSPSKTFSGTWSDRETCFRLLQEKTLDTTKVEIRVANTRNSRLFEVLSAARDKRIIITRYSMP